MKQFGPGFMVTAAIIGPGNLTVASMAGSLFGFELLWVILFSVIATAILQDMAARLGLITHKGLSESIKNLSSNKPLNYCITYFVVISLVLGNSLFAASSITGIAMSMHMFAIHLPVSTLILISGLMAITIPLTGGKNIIQPILIGLIFVMGLSFLVTMLIKPPDIHEFIKGLRPSKPDNSLFIIVAMIGSLLPSYNLFLHASTTAQKWSAQYPSKTVLRCSRIDTFTSVCIAGVLMTAVLSTAASIYFNSSIQIKNLGDIALQLEPVLGHSANSFFAAGLFAASLTSAITCPMATAFAICGAFGNSKTPFDSLRFRLTWILMLIAGTMISIAFGHNSISIVMMAQAINGIILPFIALLLLIAINKTHNKANHRNCRLANILSILVVMITFILGATQILKAMITESW